jgi:hypothetical protein
MREPRFGDLVAYVCAVQPELDNDSAERVLRLDAGLAESVANAWRNQRAFAESILELHLSLEGMPA